MKIIKKSDEKVVFLAKCSYSFANAIRRSILSIPTVAIDEVEISKNDSPLYDESFAHRLGLVPIKMEKSWKEEDILNFKLNTKKEGPVYSEEIKGDFEVVYGKIPLTLLNENQEIKIKGTTKFGKGSEHAKFTPGFLFYRNVSEIVLDKSFEEVIKKEFPENEIKTKGNKIIIIDEKEKSLLDFCEGLASKNKAEIEVKESDELIFVVESFGQLKAEDILKKAIEALKKELQDVSKNLK